MILDHPIFHRRNLARSSQEFSLEVIRRLLSSWGEPQRKFKRILVAGTNGKGSTAHTLAGLLHAAGVSVGLYTSPHMVSLNERIAFNGCQITDHDLLALIDECLRQAGAQGLEPSFFEILTACAETYFARCRSQWVVMEVGLGGRLDATHSVSPDVAVLTPIDFDHMHYLGATLERIAAEKAAIISVGGRVFSAVQKTAVMEIIEVQVAEKKARLFVQGRDFPAAFPAPNLPAYQKSNAALALGVFEQLSREELIDGRLPRDNLVEIIQKNLPQGRLQRLEGDPPFILDGAHNPHAVAGLFASLQESGIMPRDLHVVLAIRDDKDWQQMLALLPAELGSVTVCELEVATDLGPGKFVTTQNLLDAMQGRQPRLYARAEPLEALEQAIRLAREAKKNQPLRPATVLLTGSFYLLGRLLPVIEQASEMRRIANRD